MSSQRYHSTIVQRSDTIQARAVFPADFVGFDGHFPGRPILPGFMHVQLAVDVLRELGHTGELRGVEVAKFLRTIAPEDEITVSIRASEAGRYDVELTVGGETCSLFTLDVE